MKIIIFLKKYYNTRSDYYTRILYCSLIVDPFEYRLWFSAGIITTNVILEQDLHISYLAMNKMTSLKRNRDILTKDQPR